MDKSTGFIYGTPLVVTYFIIQSSNQVGLTQVSISYKWLVLYLYYYINEIILEKGELSSIFPSIIGDDPLIIIALGVLPPGLSNDQNNRTISDVPSDYITSALVIVQPSNEMGSIKTQLFFYMEPKSIVPTIPQLLLLFFQSFPLFSNTQII